MNGKSKGGFASLSPEKRRELGAKGGRRKVPKGFAMFSREKLKATSDEANRRRHKNVDR